MISTWNIWLLLASCAILFFVSYYLSRDIFHPNCIAMLFFVGTVGVGAITIGDSLNFKFSYLDFNRDMYFYTAGIWSFGLGGLAGSMKTAVKVRVDSLASQRSLTRIAFFLGGIALTVYASQVAAGGGFVAVYSNIKGRGDLGSGIQDFMFLSVPAAVVYLLSLRDRKFKLANVLVLMVILIPLWIPGFLSTRRGYAAMAMGALFFGFYMTRNRRPSMLLLFPASILGGLVLLSLVALREEIYLGSDILSRISLELLTARMTQLFLTPSEGHEFVYSSIVIDSVLFQGDYWWGARYLAVLLLWPIPSLIFPNKYAAMGLDGMLYNAGTTGSNYFDELGSPGAAPMLMADVFVEFSWASLIFLFAMSFCLARLWRKALTQSEFAIVWYVCALALMVFLFSQTFAAFIQRFVLMGAVTWAAWHYELRRTGGKQSVPRVNSNVSGLRQPAKRTRPQQRRYF